MQTRMKKKKEKKKDKIVEMRGVEPRASRSFDLQCEASALPLSYIPILTRFRKFYIFKLSVIFGG